MKCLAAVALVIIIGLPACAQRAASRGGFSGHAASSFRGGFSASAPNRFSGYGGSAPSRFSGRAAVVQRGAPGIGYVRPSFAGSRGHRRPYAPAYRGGYYNVLPGYGWVSPYVLGYPDDVGNDNFAGPADDGAGNADIGYAPEPGAYGPPDGNAQAPPAWQPPGPAAYSQPGREEGSSAPPASEEAVTLIFKDGRPPQTIHNYVLTRTTLFVGDGQRRTIPTSDLDLVATAKANQEAGVEFELP